METALNPFSVVRSSSLPICGLAISWCQFLQKSKQSAVLRSAPASSALGKTRLAAVATATASRIEPRTAAVAIPPAPRGVLSITEQSTRGGCLA